MALHSSLRRNINSLVLVSHNIFFFVSYHKTGLLPYLSFFLATALLDKPVYRMAGSKIEVVC